MEQVGVTVVRTGGQRCIQAQDIRHASFLEQQTSKFSSNKGGDSLLWRESEIHRRANRRQTWEHNPLDNHAYYPSYRVSRQIEIQHHPPHHIRLSSRTFLLQLEAQIFYWNGHGTFGRFKACSSRHFLFVFEERIRYHSSNRMMQETWGTAIWKCSSWLMEEVSGKSSQTCSP